MKIRPRKSGFFRRSLSWITKNWGLKLLAFLLALVVYYSLRPVSNNPTTNHDRRLFQQQPK